MKYPSAFVEKITGAFHEEGIQWLNRLHRIIEDYKIKWDLTIDGPVDNLSYNYVLNVTQKDGTPAILKIGVPTWDFSNEINTLTIYNGKGIVKLLRFDHKDGIMLLEKISPGNMLFGLPEELAIEQYAEVWSKLPRISNPAPSLTQINTWFSAFDRYLMSEYVNKYPLKELVLEAKSFVSDFINNKDEIFLLHGDLHHENILFSDLHGWTAIDPKGVMGHLYFDFASFMVNHLPKNEDVKQVLHNRINKISALLQLDKQKLIKASFIMATLSACWAIEDKDPNWELTYTSTKHFQSFLEESTLEGWENERLL